MTKLSDVIQRGTLASRPAATAVPTGTLYFDTTNSILYRSNGTSWESVEANTAGSVLTTKGDLLTYYSSALQRLGVGTDGHVLTADSAQAAGIKWAAAAGGSGLTQAYVGYNTVGASTEVMTGERVIAKKITLANDCLLTDVEAYIDFGQATDSVRSVRGGVFSDNAGTPQYLLSYQFPVATSLMLDTTAGAGGHQDPRWFTVASPGRWLTAGDYWIAVMAQNSDTIRIRYDGSGSDRYYTSAGGWMTDWGFYTPTTTTNTYSIRANTIR